MLSKRKEDKKKLLLVEDEPVTARIEEKELRGRGYEVVVSVDGESAVKTALDDPDIDLVLMDIDLGEGLDGPGAAEMILEKRDIPVVFLSSHIEPDVVEKTERISSYGYVVKNSGITVLDASIKMAFKLVDANKQIKERESYLSSIIKAAPSGIGIVTNRILTELNPLVCQMTGYMREELLGQSSRVLYPSDEEFEIVGTEKYRQIGEKGTGSVHTKWKKKDGTLIKVFLSSTPIDVNDLSKGVTFTALDVTSEIFTSGK